MITTGQLSFRKHLARNPRISPDQIDMGQLIIEDDMGQRLGYVSTRIETPPICLIVRVSESDAAEIKRQTEQYLQQPVGAVSMIPKVTTKTLRRVSRLLDSSGQQIEHLFEVPVDDSSEEEYADE